MKNRLTRGALFFLLLVLLASCKKDIPSDRLSFIGTWECTSCGFSQEKTIIIKSDGMGSYESIEPGKQVKFAGHVRFDGSLLKIGGAVIKKKLKIDKAPFKEIISLQPYVYQWTAKIDGSEYLKTEEE